MTLQVFYTNQIPYDFKGDHAMILSCHIWRIRYHQDVWQSMLFLLLFIFSSPEYNELSLEFLCYLIWDVYMERKENSSKKRKWQPSYHVGSHHPLLLICTSIFAVNYGICTKSNYSSSGPFSWNYLTQNKQKIKNTDSPPPFRHWKLLFQYTRALGISHL